MRPGVSLDNDAATPSRPRKCSNAESSSLTHDRDRCNTQPTTFFLSRDPDVAGRSQPSERSSTSSFSESPLSSLQDTLQEADRSYKNHAPRPVEVPVRSGSRRRSTIKPGTAERLLRRRSSTTSASANAEAPVTAHPAPADTERVPTVTPSHLPSHDVSLPSSPKSLASRQSRSKSCSASDDELLTSADETGSQAVLSSGEEDEGDVCLKNAAAERPRVLEGGIQDSQPELIMPSIKMPSRRPFTQRGKRLGRFKIMVAGRRGVGKTSLIKSMVQLCEDIVHVDTIGSSAVPGQSSHISRDSCNEVYASTKPYPEWWSTMEESRILRRRKSMGDSVLERNICFVDTADSSKLEKIIHYAEQQLVNALSSMHQLSSEFSGLLSGRGASQVDVVLYLISKDALQDDSERIRQLSEICNVVPLIAKSDLLSPQELEQLKLSLDSGVSSLPRLPSSITFLDAATAPPTEPHRHHALATAPYSVTSTNGPDLDTMDASLLMSPEYIQPLLPSELSLLVDQLFEPDTVAYLRHLAGRKLVAWHASHPRLSAAPRSPSLAVSHTQSYNPSMRNSILTSPLQTPLSPSQSGGLIPIGSEVSLNTSNSWALAKVADHTQREERLAQIRLSKWASELQLSLQRERERYERIARGERAVWLVDRMGEEVRDGKIVPVNNAQALVRKNGKGSMGSGGGEAVPSYQMHDPLGLLRWQDSMRTRGWIALQIVGSFGVMGGLAFWLAKHFGMMGNVNEWWTQGWEYLGWHD